MSGSHISRQNFVMRNGTHHQRRLGRMVLAPSNAEGEASDQHQFYPQLHAGISGNISIESGYLRRRWRSVGPQRYLHAQFSILQGKSPTCGTPLPDPSRLCPIRAFRRCGVVMYASRNSGSWSFRNLSPSLILRLQNAKFQGKLAHPTRVTNNYCIGPAGNRSQRSL